ncbi:MAG: lytic transglycosylase domain-containing protein [Proteobacteria bacterium]|nr:lytic transglycosylase domain-containing protein [Pseudomonadota bacterium]HQR03494.1 lytic transglycosylase domain-containing protein [Rhodocyclaceae bacterium]
MFPGFEQLAAQCAPQVAPSTLAAIVRVESGGNPWALNVNGPQPLPRQPSSRLEAAAWARWLVRHGYSVDMGLAQVNSRHLERLGLDAGDLFDPCTNLQAGGRILRENYAGASRKLGPGQDALHAALSAYNTGNYRRGFDNGYVFKVVAAAQAPAPSPRLLPAPGLRPPRPAPGTPGQARVFWLPR